MEKKVAVIAFNPVNGMGLFQYLETFFEHNIVYNVFAIGSTKDIKTNSGINIQLDGVVADLKGHEEEYKAVIFACGDAMLKFAEIANTQYIQDTFDILSSFNAQNKIIAGHCAAGAIFDMVGISTGKKVAVHPLGKPTIVNGIATDEYYEVDGNLYTAQCENHIFDLMPSLLTGLQ